ncbi:MAG: uracil-DNA glycosylase [Zetaproteobacteria bacterium]|nr:uracil-DNA glycosylase [Zetaproteobacteria bacterium]
MAQSFNPECRACPRLATFLDEIKETHPSYFCAPVPAFGDDHPDLLIVGLAPGMHGANRTGRPFTGDAAGILLYETLFALGLSNQATSIAADDPLQLKGVRISNAVKCLPPQNKPTTQEVLQCNTFLQQEIDQLPERCNLLALGSIAHQAVLRCYKLKQSDMKFSHGAQHTLPDGRTLTDSYHCSRYNTQTRRLTPEMFSDVMRLAIQTTEESPFARILWHRTAHG